MSKIVGAKIRENQTYTKPDGSEGVINSVDFRCVVRDAGEGIVGYDVRRYSAKIDDLKYIFGLDPSSYGNITDYVKSLLCRECILETKASAFDGKLTEQLVGVTFLDKEVKK
ncbi:MAG: hypothetical protein ACI3XS_04600 [Eubacteriales bacterium]